MSIALILVGHLVMLVMLVLVLLMVVEGVLDSCYKLAFRKWRDPVVVVVVGSLYMGFRLVMVQLVKPCSSSCHGSSPSTHPLPPVPVVINRLNPVLVPSRHHSPLRSVVLPRLPVVGHNTRHLSLLFRRLETSSYP